MKDNTRAKLQFYAHLDSIGACAAACIWAQGRTARQAWRECPHYEWLLWWAQRTRVNTRREVAKAARAARVAYYPFDQKRLTALVRSMLKQPWRAR